MGADFSMGVGTFAEVVSEAHDCGLLAFVDPGDEAVACNSDLSEPDAAAFSALRHFARRF